MKLPTSEKVLLSVVGNALCVTTLACLASLLATLAFPSIIENAERLSIVLGLTCGGSFIITFLCTEGFDIEFFGLPENDYSKGFDRFFGIMFVVAVISVFVLVPIADKGWERLALRVAAVESCSLISTFLVLFLIGDYAHDRSLWSKRLACILYYFGGFPGAVAAFFAFPAVRRDFPQWHLTMCLSSVIRHWYGLPFPSTPAPLALREPEPPPANIGTFRHGVYYPDIIEEEVPVRIRIRQTVEVVRTKTSITIDTKE
jgi:hypothetical protein